MPSHQKQQHLHVQISKALLILTDVSRRNNYVIVQLLNYTLHKSEVNCVATWAIVLKICSEGGMIVISLCELTRVKLASCV